MELTRRHILKGLAGCACCGLAGAPTNPLLADELDVNFICTLKSNRNTIKLLRVRKARPEAKRLLGHLTDLIGMRHHIKIIEGDFDRSPIASAGIMGPYRVIVYDAEWFTFENDQVSWYSVYVLGHEIGHHIYGHTHKFKHGQHQGELDADRFGGWAVAKLGGRLDQALALTRVFSEEGSESHPPRDKRIEAVQTGWLSGSQSYDR